MRATACWSGCCASVSKRLPDLPLFCLPGKLNLASPRDLPDSIFILIPSSDQFFAGAAGQPRQLVAAGIDSPFMTSVSAPSLALSLTTAPYSTKLRGPM
ncbi:hypothetical protein SAMN04515618_11030 [Collimonas sp. OK307]|nr:hypothetical protein SAMN04515618_11030 [Collimonas sp. OK307]